MDRYIIEAKTLTGIADAIRSKTGGAEAIPVTDMAAQISGITGGGSSVVLPKFEFSDGYFDVGTDNSARTISHGMRKMPDLIIVYAQCLTGKGMANLEIPSTTSFLMAWGVKSTFQCDTRSGYLFNTWGHDDALGLDNLTAGEIGDGYVYCQDNSTFVVDGGGHLIPNARYLWFAFSGISAAGVQTAGDHTVTFMSEDGSTVLGEKPVMHGDTCGDPVALGLFEEPTKESTAQYQYPFDGWSLTAGGEADSNALVNVTEDRTVYVAFKAETRLYTVNFYDEDSIIETLYVPYGGTAEYIPDNKSGYIFNRWEPSNINITSDTNCYAVWDSTLSFAAASWSEISTISSNGEASQYFNIGDERTVTNGTYTYTLRIIAFNRDFKAWGSSSTHGITVMALPVDRATKFGSNNTSKWPDNSLSEFLSGTFPDRLPSDLKNVIKTPTLKTCHMNSGSSSVSTQQNNYKYFVPSVQNLAKSTVFTGNEGYTGFYQGMDEPSKRIIRDANGNPVNWWLRNHDTSSTAYVDTEGVIHEGRYAGGNIDKSYYIAPCFCI